MLKKEDNVMKSISTQRVKICFFVSFLFLFLFSIKPYVSLADVIYTYGRLPERCIVNVIDTATKVITTKITVDQDVKKILFSKDGRKAYVVLRDKIVVVNTSTYNTVGELNVKPAISEERFDIWDVAFSPKGEKLYVLVNIFQQGKYRSIIFTVDSATDQMTSEKDTGKFFLRLVVASDGVMAFNADRNGNVSIYEISTEKEPIIVKLPNWTSDNTVGMVYVTPDRKWIILPETKQEGELRELWLIDTESYQVRMIDQIPGYWRGFATSPDGNKLYAGMFGALVVIDLARGEILSVIERLAKHIFVSPKGDRLYLPLTSLGIDVIDAASYETIDHIDVPAWKIAVRPDVN